MSEQRDLRADLELCQKATPGPWKPFRDTFEPAIYTKLEDGCRGVCVARLEGLHGERQRNDANFIAAAREGWPEAIERAIKAESKNTESYDLLYSVFDTTKEEAERLKDDNAALREANDLQRDSIQQLSAQVAAYRKVIMNCPIEDQDGCNCPDCKAVRRCENVLQGDPGAEIMEHMAKLEAVAEAARDYREHEYLASTDKWHEVIDRLDKSLDALEAVTPCT